MDAPLQIFHMFILPFIVALPLSDKSDTVQLAFLNLLFTKFLSLYLRVTY